MEVKDVFELRKQGRIEEAYEAIRPMYAVHKGHYTTLCMFWTASDVLKKRVKEKRIDEALKIFEALMRMLPTVEDRDGRAHSTMLHAAVTLSKESPTFSMLAFLERYGLKNLREEDWKSPTPGPSRGGEGSIYITRGETAHNVTTPLPPAGGAGSGASANNVTTPLPPAGGAGGGASGASHPIPSVAHQLLTQVFHEVKRDPTADTALRALPLLEEAVRRTPRNKNCRRYMAVVYAIMGEREKAAAIYRELLRYYRDSYLYAELADLTDDLGTKAALLCKAIMNQRQEQFRQAYRLDLARLLLNPGATGNNKPYAAHELQKCLATREVQGLHPTREMRQMLEQLKDVKPTNDYDQQDFYRRMAKKYNV